MALNEETGRKSERAVVIGLDDGSDEFPHSFLELQRLAETAGATVVGELVQKREAPDPRTYLGKGKLNELCRAAGEMGADLVIADDELTPGQQREMESATGLRVVDRAALILDIFALHAASAEGKLQVEMAQLDYGLSRMKGKGIELSRMGAAAGGVGIAARGPGETKLEVDRRRARERLSRLQRELRHLEAHRARQRQKRLTGKALRVALVGYTNSGKTSLLRALTGSEAFVDDMLFATLDPLTRRLHWKGADIVISDTVGFIEKLPHQLVAAFHSTLEEAMAADVLLLVLDASAEDSLRQLAASRRVLAEIGAEDSPTIIVLNKSDAADAGHFHALQRLYPEAVAVSARARSGLDALKDAILARQARLPLSLEIPEPATDESLRLLAGSFQTMGVREGWHGGSAVLVRRLPGAVMEADTFVRTHIAAAGEAAERQGSDGH